MSAAQSDTGATHEMTSDKSVLLLIKLLRFTRYALIFIFVTVIGIAARLPIFPLRLGGDPADPEARWPTIFLGTAIDPEITLGALYAQSAVNVILIIAGLFVITDMLKLLNNVARQRAFVRENGKLLRRMGYAGIIAQISVYVVWFTAQATDIAGIVEVDGLVMSINPAPWIIILCAFALSTVFNDATALKEEQDLTV